MRLDILPFVCAVALCLLLAGMQPAAARRVALVIGNSTYQHVPELANPANDAADMSARLEALGFTVIEGRDLTLTAMRDKVREFMATLSDADIGLFYYAGHGLQVNGRNYLAPVDAQLITYDDLEFEALPIGLILTAMERKTKTNLVFLDACRNNPLARNLARSMGTRSTDVGRGLARISSGVGTLISFSTQPGNVALDGTGRNSPFTSALVKHIGTPGEDITRSLRRVRSDVLQATNGKQVPWENSSLTGDVILKEKEEPAPLNSEKDDTTAALMERLAETQEQLKKAQEQLSNQLEEQADIAENVRIPTKKTEPEIAALSPNGDRKNPPDKQTPSAIETSLAARNYKIAKRVNSRRGWQLFTHEHGGNRLYGPLGLKQLGLARSTGSPDARSREVETFLGLGRSDKSKIQTALNTRGYGVGDADGVFGPKTRNAIREFQLATGQSGTGFVDGSLLELLGIDIEVSSGGNFVSDSLAKVYQPEDLSALGEKEAIVDTIACIGAHWAVVYGQRGDRAYFAVLGGQTNVPSQIKTAKECGGSLVTIEDANENRYVYDLIKNDPRFFRYWHSENGYLTEKLGPAIGLQQDVGAREPSGGWKWLSGRTSRYRNWFRGEPNDNNGYSRSTRFYARARGKPNMANTDASRWDDFPGSSHAYVMEVEVER